MYKPNDYDNVALSNFKELPAGGYVCRILKAEERVTSTDKPMLVIALDICEGQYSNYFMNLFKERKRNSNNPLNVKYPNNGMVYLVTVNAEGKTRKQFKSFVTSVEESGRRVAWGDGFCKSLEGATVGVLFGREEYEGNDGKNHWSVKPFFFRSVEKILSGDWKTPEDRPLPEMVGYGANGYGNDFVSNVSNLFGNDVPVTDNTGEFNATTDDIPFN